MNPDATQTKDDNSSLTSILFQTLNECEYENALKTLKGKEYAEYIKHNSLEIVPALSSVLEETFCTIETEECIEEMLIYVASIANQKEALLAFLEEVEMFRSKKQVKVVIKPLETILMHNVSSKANSDTFSWVFNTLTAHVSALPLPSEAGLEGKERILLDADPNLHYLTDVLSLILEFYYKFYEKVLAKELIWPEKNLTSGEFLSFFILHIFDKPLTFLDVYNDESGESFLYILCSKFVMLISNLIIHPFKLLSYIKPKKLKKSNSDEAKPQDTPEEADEQVDHVSQLSLATYFYFVLGQRMSEANLPCVYANDYLYFSCLPCCVYLMEEKGVYPVYKGLVLLKSLLGTLGDSSLPNGCLEVPNHLQILRDLVQVMTLCKSKECRTLALDCLKQWLLKLQTAERYRIFVACLTTVSHSGILGVIIHELKENVRQTLLNSQVMDTNFSGSKLQKILRLSCTLPHGEMTDLLEWSDKIMGALNLLIFICLSDSKNDLNYKCVLPEISKEFLLSIENGLRMSKGHYDLRIRELDEGKKNKQSSAEVSVNGECFPNMSPEQERTMMMQALNWFEIMQSVWARANKLVSESIVS